MNNRNINVSFLLNYFVIKLGQYFRFNVIFNQLKRRFDKLYYVVGWRVVVCGRLTRKERAAFIVKGMSQPMPLSTYKIDFKLHYGSDFKIMKFGVVGIKIWLLLLRQQAPYYYVMTFINKV